MRFSQCFPLGCAAVIGLSLSCSAGDSTAGPVLWREASRPIRESFGLPLGAQPVLETLPAPAAFAAPPRLLAQAQPATDAAAIERAREQLRQKMSELEAQQGGATPVTTETAPAAAAQPAVAAAPAANPALTQGQEEALRKALEDATKQPPTADATRKAKAELSARTKAEARRKAPVTAAPKTAEAAPAGRKTTQQTVAKEAPQPLPETKRGALVFPPTQAPPLPVSAEQQRKLAELLTRYMADQVTPEEYQRERAKILSEK